MKNIEWLLCPVCGNKTRLKTREDTELKNFPLFCPKCKQETLINVKQLNMSVTIVQGNALDLSSFADNQYDLTLLLGPLYHLYSEEDKRRAISEAIRVTKPNGVVFAAYVISDGCLIDEGFKRNNISVVEYIKNGLLDAETFAAKSEPKDLFELVRKEDIDYIMSVFDVKRLHYVATDGCALLLREAIDAMDDDTFRLFLKYHFATCEREDLVGITSHALDIFQKI